MKYLAKTLAVASIAALLAMSSTADAKSSREHKSKKATASKIKAKAKTASASDIPWYEQGIADLTPAPKARKAPKAQNRAFRVEMTQMTLGFERVGRHQHRRSQAPSGLCKQGCDKTQRQINMNTLVLVKERKATPKTKTTKRSRVAEQLDIAIIVSHR